MRIPAPRQSTDDDVCCPDLTACALCERPLCHEHDDDAEHCEINGLVCADCHRACMSYACGQANDPAI